MISLDRSKNDSSITLDLLRAIAAQSVCVGHGLVFFSVGEWARPPYFPYIQNIGVLLFFIMSGFLIAATLIQNSSRPGYTFVRYLIDQFARIYSGLVPALTFVVVVDWITLHLASAPTIARYYNFKALVANLSMLECYRGIFPRSLQWYAFGSASPLWTLSIEWHIYLFIGAVFFAVIKRRPMFLLIPVALFFGQTPMHFLLGGFQADGGIGTGLFSLWLGGAGLYVMLSRYVPPRWVAATALVCGLVAYALLVTPGHEYEWATYPALILIVGALVAVTQYTRSFGRAHWIRTVADYSFTLYLIHYTIMSAFYFAMPKAKGWGWFFLAISLANLAAYLIARPFEMKHRRFAEWICQKLGLQTVGPLRTPSLQDTARLRHQSQAQ